MNTNRSTCKCPIDRERDLSSPYAGILRTFAVARRCSVIPAPNAMAALAQESHEPMSTGTIPDLAGIIVHARAMAIIDIACPRTMGRLLGHGLVRDGRA